MLRLGLVCSVVVTLFAGPLDCTGKTNAMMRQDAAAYRLRVAVDEVNLTFHAADVNGLPSKDLKLSDVRLTDDGKPPLKILDFKLLQDLPVRAEILIDTSESMRAMLPEARIIATAYAEKILRRTTDEAFIAEFGRFESVMQPWTNDPSTIVEGVRTVSEARADSISGTAVYDALFRTCLYQFGAINHAASGDFILLFSDGEDNASYVSLKDAVDMCQRSNTAIYDFHKLQHGGEGDTADLLELAKETGGRMFLDDGSSAGIYEDLRSNRGRYAGPLSADLQTGRDEA